MQPHESHTYREIISQGQSWKSTLESLPSQWGAISDWEECTQPVSQREARVRGLGEEALIIGCGSTYYLSLSVASFWRSIVGQPARALPASEVWLFPESSLTVKPMTMLAISRSGETTETLRALEVFRSHSFGECLAITCYPQSSLARLADRLLVAVDAHEESIAQTRSFSTMFLLALAVACRLGGRQDLLDQMSALPAAFARLLEKYETLARGIAAINRFERMVFLGSGVNYGLACEAMLKMKELSLTPSEAFHFMEFRHGPISVVGPGTLVLGIISASASQAEAQVLQEVQKLGATTLAVVENGFGVTADYTVELHSGLAEPVSRILTLPVLQLVAFYRALHKGLDPDRPAHLEAVVRLPG